jgi:hypothetical protein
MSFNDRNQTLATLVAKIEPKHRQRYAGALAKLVRLSAPKSEKEARTLAEDKGPLGPRRVAHHALRGELAAAAQEVIRMGMAGSGPQANLTWPHPRSAEAEVRGTLEAVRLELEHEAAPPAPPKAAAAGVGSNLGQKSTAPAGDPPKG